MKIQELNPAECREINGGSQQISLGGSIAIGSNDTLLTLTFHQQNGDEQSRTTTLSVGQGISLNLGAYLNRSGS
ncbi:hypothetical protein [Pedobacter sp. SYP-B3415]|uniref:hypothetical protein n=1 Tax=Pedobacter sp. SYP-B3415 TaxID=2496641 RepID=UPI00101D68E5|nr:hypothetical protein [Pedobacter sp. SYP-B3415]